MADPAKYLVTQPPGAPVDLVGFVRPGESFTAPNEDYVPSKTFRPMNDAAKAALEKVYDNERDRLQAAVRATKATPLEAELAKLEEQRKDATQVRAEPEVEQPKIKQELTLGELGKTERQSQQAPHEHTSAQERATRARDEQSSPPHPLDAGPGQASDAGPGQHPTPAEAKAAAKADKEQPDKQTATPAKGGRAADK